MSYLGIVMKKSVLIFTLTLINISSLFQVKAEEISFYSPIKEGRSESADMRSFAKKVSQLTAGSVNFNMHYMGELGFDNTELLRQLKRGYVGAGAVYPPYLSRDVPAFGALYIEGALLDFKSHEPAISVIEDSYRTVFDNWGIEYVGYAQPPLYDVSVFCKNPINTIAGLKRKKLRVWTSAQVETFNNLGIAAQIIPSSEMYMALQTGVVDCALYLGEIGIFASLHEVAPYEAFLVPFASLPVALGVNKNIFNRLSDEQQAAVREAGQWISAKTLKKALNDVAAKTANREARAKGGIKQLPAFSKQDVEKFVTAANEVWFRMAKEGGEVSLKVYESLMTQPQECISTQSC
ncbi:C4-dicarboxylate transport system C4-dicarboxylate-binding protein [Grimontia indica]|uniref:C4-dicarboxylate transport system C4-dicarboxylate-binding protein n=2 Tax=Grimontia indica TaxID=1056512 RepID=R1GTQ4_9GAMM|nr:C4-dicarboxylate transport system C4-dicarboxylate-binding protein [Grimontia indica]